MERGERRREARLQFDVAADRGRGALLHRQADPLEFWRRVGGRPRRLEPIDPQHEAVAALALLPHLDEARQRDREHRPRQHTMRDALGLQRCGRKACGRSRYQRDGDKQSQFSRKHGRGNERQRQRNDNPDDGLAIGGKIGRDASAEGNRDPREKLAALGLYGRMALDRGGKTLGALIEAVEPRPIPAAPRRGVGPGLDPASAPAPLDHNATPATGNCGNSKQLRSSGSQPLPTSFANVSRNPTVRLKTRWPGFESGSRVK